MKKLVIGLIGEKGSGKETFTNLLKVHIPDRTIDHIRFSDALNQTLVDYGIPTTRENLQKLGHVLRETYGNGVVAEAVMIRAQKSEATIIVTDGVRYKEDVEAIRKLPGTVLVYLTADLNTRYNRIKTRKEKAGEDSVSLEQFIKEESAYTELQIPVLGAQADHKLENNGGLEELSEKVAKLVKTLQLTV